MIFEKGGPANTEQVMDIVFKTAKERGIKHIVAASNTGYTAAFLKDCGLNAVCVTHANGFAKKGENELTAEARQDLEAHGVKVYTGTHVLSGVERGISKAVGGMYPAEIIANSLRMLSQGVKVCTEIAIMALDAGLIPYGEEIIAIGGSGRGADTACVMTPEHANAVFGTKIHEILCKPR